MSPFTSRPPDSRVRAYRAAGVWRDYGSIGYLRRSRGETPQALVVTAFGPSDAPAQISCRQVAFSRHDRQSLMRLPWRVNDDA